MKSVCHSRQLSTQTTLLGRQSLKTRRQHGLGGQHKAGMLSSPSEHVAGARAHRRDARGGAGATKSTQQEGAAWAQRERRGACLPREAHVTPARPPEAAREHARMSDVLAKPPGRGEGAHTAAACVRLPLATPSGMARATQRARSRRLRPARGRRHVAAVGGSETSAVCTRGRRCSRSHRGARSWRAPGLDGAWDLVASGAECMWNSNPVFPPFYNSDSRAPSPAAWHSAAAVDGFTAAAAAACC